MSNGTLIYLSTCLGCSSPNPTSPPPTFPNG